MDSRSLAPQTLQASQKTMWDPLCFVFTCFCHVNKDLVPEFCWSKWDKHIYTYISIYESITQAHHQSHQGTIEITDITDITRKQEQRNEWFFLQRSCHSSFRKEQRKAAELEALKSVARAQEPKIWKWNDMETIWNTTTVWKLGWKYESMKVEFSYTISSVFFS